MVWLQKTEFLVLRNQRNYFVETGDSDSFNQNAFRCAIVMLIQPIFFFPRVIPIIKFSEIKFMNKLYTPQVNFQVSFSLSVYILRLLSRRYSTLR